MNWFFTSKAIIADRCECLVVIAKMVTCSVFVDNLAFGTATGKLSAITTGHSPLSAIIALLVKDQLEGDTDGTRDTFKYLKNWKIHLNTQSTEFLSIFINNPRGDKYSGIWCLYDPRKIKNS